MRALIATALLVLASCGSNPTVRIERDESCPKALDAAEVLIDKQSKALTASGDAITSFVNGDAQGIANANATLEDLSSTVEADAAKYQRLADECRSGS